MNGKELRRGEVLNRVKRGELKLTEAAELLELSYRQAKRLKKRYGEGGRGRPNTRVTSGQLNPTLARWRRWRALPCR